MTGDDVPDGTIEEPTDDLWDRHAEWWQRQFTGGVDPEYVEQILPLARDLAAGFDRVLEIGTGEGQLAREVFVDRPDGRGAQTVIGLDITVGQITEAVRRAGGPVYGVSDAAALPVRSASFDAAVACLVFEHIDAVDEAIAEVARVVRPGGRFVFFLNHPLLQTPGSGWIDDHIIEPPEQYWRIGPYLVEASTIEEVEKDVHIRFVHRPLSRYVNALAVNGLVLEQMVEPAPPQGFLDRAPEYPDAATVPRLLVLVTRRTT